MAWSFEWLGCHEMVQEYISVRQIPYSRAAEFTTLSCTAQWFSAYSGVVQPDVTAVNFRTCSSPTRDPWACQWGPSPWHPLVYFPSLDLPLLVILCQWNHTVCGLLLCLVPAMGFSRLTRVVCVTIRGFGGVKQPGMQSCFITRDRGSGGIVWGCGRGRGFPDGGGQSHGPGWALVTRDPQSVFQVFCACEGREVCCLRVLLKGLPKPYPESSAKPFNLILGFISFVFLSFFFWFVKM